MYVRTTARTHPLAAPSPSGCKAEEDAAHSGLWPKTMCAGG
jgi:hypothetical protein